MACCESCGKPAQYRAQVAERYMSDRPIPVERRVSRLLCSPCAFAADDARQILAGTVRISA